MLAVDWDTVRLFVHILAASVWVGGQLVVAGLLGTVRALDPDAPRTVARAFARVAWPAYGLAVATGVWNLLEVELGDRSNEYLATLGLKVAAVVLSGIAAAAHAMARSRTVLATGGALGGLSAVGALFLGVMLRSG